jgi:hypothetical protein
MNKHYIFWPFESRHYTDMGGNSQGAGRNVREFRRTGGSNTSYVIYGSRKHLGKLTHCNSPDKSIYVTGHGAAGNTFVYNTPNGNDDAVHAILIVTRLIEYGLRKTSKCKLKLFSCYSGSAGPGLQMGLAQAVKLCLNAFHYDDIDVYGYTESVIANDGSGHTAFLGNGPMGGYGIWSHAKFVRVLIP